VKAFEVKGFEVKEFDLIEFQREARSRNRPGELFRLWEEVCRYYDQGLISRYELEEMKTVVWPNLRVLSSLQMEIDSSFGQIQPAA
jgi:hypothetical protein